MLMEEKNTLLEKLKLIKEGWGNLIWENEEVEKVANMRAVICAGCDQNKGGVCFSCGCILISKTRSPKANCPLQKW